MASVRRRVAGQLELDLTPHEAIELFTPEGERSWAPGWSPVYVDAEPNETPGTVFTTAWE